MRDSIRLGRMAGIPVGMNWSVLLVAAFLTWSLSSGQLPDVAEGHSDAAYLAGGVVAALVFFGSLLAHELAHALVARRNGVGTEGITLWFLGGVARLDREAPTPGAEFRIAAAGPATSLALGVAFGAAAVVTAVADLSTLWTAVLAWLTVINVVLALFNLLPGAPLDGGRILSAALWRVWGDRTRASVAAARAGQGLGVLFLALPFVGVLTGAVYGGLWTAVMGLFLFQSATGEASGARVRAALTARTVRALMTPVREVNDWWTLDELDRTGLSGGAPTALVVRDWGGRPSGVVVPGALARVPQAARTVIRLRDLALRPDQVRTAWPDESVLDALRRPGPDTMVLVAVEDGRIVGVVTPDVLARAAGAVEAAPGPNRWTPARPGALVP